MVVVRDLGAIRGVDVVQNQAGPERKRAGKTGERLTFTAELAAELSAFLKILNAG